MLNVIHNFKGTLHYGKASEKGNVILVPNVVLMLSSIH